MPVINFVFSQIGTGFDDHEPAIQTELHNGLSPFRAWIRIAGRYAGQVEAVRHRRTVDLPGGGVDDRVHFAGRAAIPGDDDVVAGEVRARLLLPVAPDTCSFRDAFSNPGSVESLLRGSENGGGWSSCEDRRHGVVFESGELIRGLGRRDRGCEKHQKGSSGTGDHDLDFISGARASYPLPTPSMTVGVPLRTKTAAEAAAAS